MVKRKGNECNFHFPLSFIQSWPSSPSFNINIFSFIWIHQNNIELIGNEWPTFTFSFKWNTQFLFHKRRVKNCWRYFCTFIGRVCLLRQCYFSWTSMRTRGLSCMWPGFDIVVTANGASPTSIWRVRFGLRWHLYTIFSVELHRKYDPPPATSTRNWWGKMRENSNPSLWWSLYAIFGSVVTQPLDDFPSDRKMIT